MLDDLLSTGGMLPSRELASRVVGFFEDGYWRAEGARVEALRRQVISQRIRPCRVADRSRGHPMTADGARDVVSGERPARQALGPLLTIRAMQVALWLLVISGPVAALLVATQMASLGGRLDVLSVGAGVEVPPDTSGAQGFAELFIASYLGAGENSADGLSPFLDGVSLDGVEAGSWSATRTTSLGAEEMAPGYYAVMVAAEVVAADHDADEQPVWVPVGTRFYSRSSIGMNEQR